MLQAILVSWKVGEWSGCLLCFVGFFVIVMGIALAVRAINGLAHWETSEIEKVKAVPTVVRRYSPDGHMLKGDISGSEPLPYWRHGDG